jgi:hypothetical protein
MMVKKTQYDDSQHFVPQSSGYALQRQQILNSKLLLLPLQNDQLQKMVIFSQEMMRSWWDSWTEAAG